MKITRKAVMVAAMIMLTAAASACAASSGQSTSAVGGGTSPAGTSPAGSGTSPAANYAQGADGSPASAGSADNGPATNNRVLLGVAFLGAPPPISFGDVNPGESKTLQIEIDNGGADPVTIVSVTVDPGAFSSAGDCDNRALNPSDSCVLPVTFNPGDNGTYGANITITVASGNSTTVGLKGSAGSPSAPSQTVSPVPSGGSPEPSGGSS
jgi:Abnormal spindle-like microcephaly-assoc'd, ASPM-SPD-2-Hydin